MQIASIGIDIGKLTFHLVALDEQGGIVVTLPPSGTSGHRIAFVVGFAATLPIANSFINASELLQQWRIY